MNECFDIILNFLFDWINAIFKEWIELWVYELLIDWLIDCSQEGWPVLSRPTTTIPSWSGNSGRRTGWWSHSRIFIRTRLVVWSTRTRTTIQYTLSPDYRTGARTTIQYTLGPDYRTGAGTTIQYTLVMRIRIDCIRIRIHKVWSIRIRIQAGSRSIKSPNFQNIF